MRICPACGHRQPEGQECANCRTPLVEAPAEAPPASQEPIQPGNVEVKPPPPIGSGGPAVAPDAIPLAPSPEPEPEPFPPLEPSEGTGQTAKVVRRFTRITVTTGQQVEGQWIQEYREVVAGHALVRLEGIGPFIAGLKEPVALNQSPFREGIEKGKTAAEADLRITAARLGANAVIGASLQFNLVAEALWITMVGTAVVTRPSTRRR